MPRLPLETRHPHPGDAVIHHWIYSSNNLSVHVSDDEENLNPTEEFMSPEVTEVSTSTATTAENPTILKCNLLCCTYDGRHVPEKFSHFESTNDKHNFQLGWFNKHDWLSYCQVRKPNKIFYKENHNYKDHEH
ncbi:unnamed protein product [Rotaria magnacalcarata]|uniref:Uncharacterized protein n=2 Tax=Rotaria magnacalcarata TaxID=392030 RepID=A0A8S2J585_9BILA|nr:unnamed protein product [Rotaria magnacalcarata]